MEWRNDTISEMMMREQGDGRPTHTERWMERERGREGEGKYPLFVPVADGEASTAKRIKSKSKQSKTMTKLAFVRRGRNLARRNTFKSV